MIFAPKAPGLLELAEQALSSTTEGYDLLAEKFEYSPFCTDDEVLEPLVAAASEHGSIGTALDVCCGTGVVMRRLRPHCDDRVVGIDRSKGMIAEGRKLFEGADGDAPGDFVCGDALQMDFDAQFDVATCCGAFGHILEDQQAEFAARIWSALRPGGRFLFVTRPMPSVASVAWLASRGFNAAMHLRNAVLKPPFIMFYLTFTLERAREVLGRNGFELEVRQPYRDTDYEAMRLVVATRG